MEQTVGSVHANSKLSTYFYKGATALKMPQSSR